MPTYSYSCKKCQHKYDEFKPISKRNETKCLKCGSTEVDRFIGQGSGFIFRGDGFYATSKKEAEMYQPMNKEK